MFIDLFVDFIGLNMHNNSLLAAFEGSATQPSRLFEFEQRTGNKLDSTSLPPRKFGWTSQKPSHRVTLSGIHKPDTLAVHNPNQELVKETSVKTQPSVSFVSAGQMRKGIKAPSYSPQFEIGGIVNRFGSFDEFVNDTCDPFDENVALNEADFVSETEEFPNSSDVEPVSISSCVIPGLPSLTKEASSSTPIIASTAKIPSEFQSMFPYSSFNEMQQIVMSQLLTSDRHVVICAPTGAGKTVMLEFAMVRVLQSIQCSTSKPVILYLSPLKSLCAERVVDWKRKFAKIGFIVNELTGDSDIADVVESEILATSHLICSTPEKWDWITRRWQQFTSSIQLILIDEVHSVGADNRGPTLEAVITRMKMLKSSKSQVRFVAVSATAPNIADIGQWFSSDTLLASSNFKTKIVSNAAKVFHFDERYRPVPLEKVVIGYSSSEKHNAFSFDSILNYKLPSVIENYSYGKPTLVFCMSRKSAESSATFVAANLKRPFKHSAAFIESTRQLTDSKLRTLVLQGFGYHHAGLAQTDRQVVEQLFVSGQLPVLFSTSTLAVGVNLPAHLVVVKSTWHCTGPMGSTEELSDSDLLQMIGRAGRPQFDTQGRAVVMTRESTKHRYESLLSGQTVIESYLHRRLVEHMNAELVLGTIGTVSLALEWIKQTFLYVRLSKNSAFYAFDLLQKKQASVDEFLTSLILSALDELDGIGLVTISRNSANAADTKLKTTPFGRLMARHCIALSTMKLIMEVSNIPDDSLISLIGLVATCSELEDVVLRWNERSALNALNKKCKFPVDGGVKTKTGKISVLIQATLGCLPIEHAALVQDCHRIFRVASRIATCLLETLWLRADAAQASFGILQSICIFSKLVRVQLWHDSEHVAKQLPGIGATLSNALVRDGIVTFEKLANTNANRLDAVCGRHTPFGMNLRNAVAGISRYQVSVNQLEPVNESSAQISVSLQLTNASYIAKNSYAGTQHKVVVLIGDSRNVLLGHYRLTDRDLIEAANNSWSSTVTVTQMLATEPKPNFNRPAASIKVFTRVISLEVVGIDVTAEFEPKFVSFTKTKSVRFALSVQPRDKRHLTQNSDELSSSESATTIDCSTEQHFDKLKMFSASLSRKHLAILAGEDADANSSSSNRSEDSVISRASCDLPCVVVDKPDTPTKLRNEFSAATGSARKVSNEDKKISGIKAERQTTIDGYLVPREYISDESCQDQNDADLPNFDISFVPAAKPTRPKKASQKRPRVGSPPVGKSSYFQDDGNSEPMQAAESLTRNDLKSRFSFKSQRCLQSNSQTSLGTAMSNVNNLSKNGPNSVLIQKEKTTVEQKTLFLEKPAPPVIHEKQQAVELFDVFNAPLW